MAINNTETEKTRYAMPGVWSSVEDWLVDWNVPLQVASLVLALGTIAIGALTIWAGKVSGDRLEAKLAGTNAVAETAKESTEALKKENLELALNLETERIKRLELEGSLEYAVFDIPLGRGKLLRPELRERLTEAVAALPEKCVLVTAATSGDEPFNFAWHMGQVLDASGRLGRSVKHSAGDNALHDVQVQGESADIEPIVEALNAGGILATADPQLMKENGPQVVIRVGLSSQP